MNIYVDDRLKTDYEDALAKLKADRYGDKIPPSEREMLEEKVMRWLMIRRLEQEIAELNDGASPYDYAGFEHIDIYKS